MMMRMPVMVAVAVMHEQMHQRAGQQKQVGQYPQQMCAVFGKQEETGNRKKADQHPSAAGTLSAMILQLMFM